MEIFGIVVIVVIGLAIVIVGNGLLLGIFLYEKYGVDSMRRTTNNMLWSQLCLMYITVHTLGLPFGIYGYCLNEVTGGIGYSLGMWTMILVYSSDNFCSFILMEIALLKCLYIKNWSWMVHIDDYFLATFLGLFNTMIISLKMSIAVGMGEIDGMDIFIKSTGLNNTQTDQHKQLASELFYWNTTFPFVLMASLGIFASVLILLEKYKTWKVFNTKVAIFSGLEQNNISNSSETNSFPLQSLKNLNLNPNIGTDGRNIPLAGNIATAIVLLTGFGMLTPLILYEGFGVDLGYNWDIFAYLSPSINASLLIPSLFFARNPKVVKVVLEVLSEMFGVDLNPRIKSPCRNVRVCNI